MSDHKRRKSTASDTNPFRTRKDLVGRTHFRSLRSAPESVARFRKFQSTLLSGKLLPSDAAGSLAAHMIAWDGIATRHDLLAALQNSHQLYLWHDYSIIDWADDDGRTNRRFISALTQKSWATLSEQLRSPEKIIEELESAISKLYPTADPTRVDQLLLDCKIYLMCALPGPLLAHCLATNLLAAIPRSVFAREESRQAILENSQATISRNSEIGFSMALDGYFSASRSDRGSGLISALVDACRNQKSDVHHIDKREMLRRCLNLTPMAEQAGKTASLVLAWAIDLIESGTLKEYNIAPGTIRLYVRYGAQAIYKNFKDREIDEIDSDTFAQIYQTIINQAQKAAQSTASALKSWHAFLQQWLDAAPLKVSLYKGINPSIPQANILWPHELVLISVWIDSATCDERLASQIRISHLIASSIRIRISELLKLRIRNIRWHQSTLEIEICPMRRDGALKTKASKRVSVISNSEVSAQILQWVECRKSEGALTEDLLFGDPHNPSRGYKLGQLYVTLNMLLKHATGDATASFHIYSHTHISNGIEDALMTNNDIEISQLDLLAADVGHTSVQTSLQHYFHKFELPLHHSLDHAIKSIPLNSSIVSLHSHISAAAFRQRCSRGGADADNNLIGWKILRTPQIRLPAPIASSVFEFRSATPPPSIHKSSDFEFSDLLHMLADLSDGLSVDATSSRTGAPEETVHHAAIIACNLMEELGIAGKAFHPRTGIGAVAELQLLLSQPHFRSMQFSRVGQPKMLPLRRYLLLQADSMPAQAGTSSWKACFTKGYIDLTSPAKAAGLINLLSAAKISIEQIVVCTESPTGPDAVKHRIRLHQIGQLFSSAFSVVPRVVHTKARRGRPHSYLSISGVSLADDRINQGAALSNGGLNALLFTASVYLRLTDSLNSPSKETQHHD